MNFFEEFRKMDGSEFGFFAASLCGSVCPGIVAIWLFDPALILAMTTPKLIALSLSFTLPCVMLNCWIIGLTTGADPKAAPNKIFIQLFLQASIASSLIFSIGLAVRFFFDTSMPWFVVVLAILEFLFFARQSGRQHNQSTNPPEQTTPPEPVEKP